MKISIKPERVPDSETEAPADRRPLLHVAVERGGYARVQVLGFAVQVNVQLRRPT